MTKGGKHALVGGYSRARNRSTGAQAPVWTVAAADLAHRARAAIDEGSAQSFMLRMAAEPQLAAQWHRALLATVPASGAQRDLARQVVGFNVARIRKAERDGGAAKARAAADACVATWNRNAIKRATVAQVEPPPPHRPGPQSMAAWLEAAPTERRRPLAASPEVVRRIDAWRLWQTKPAIIFPERAKRRCLEDRERKGLPLTAAFLARLVCETVLSTVIAKECDHPLRLDTRQWCSPLEVSRAFGIRSFSPIHDALDVLTPRQAVACLGRGVVACAARAALVAAGLLELLQSLRRPLRYASAFSQIDMIAAELDTMAREWEFVFASESVGVRRRALLAAWRDRGLSEETVFWDAAGEDALAAPPVDLFTMTPECLRHSRANSAADADDEAVSIEVMTAALGYVGSAMPSIVVIENVDEPTVVGMIDAVLHGVPSHAWSSMAYDPAVHGEWPMHRRRRFWMGKLKHA